MPVFWLRYHNQHLQCALEILCWTITFMSYFATIVLFYSVPVLFDMLGRPDIDNSVRLYACMPCTLMIILLPSFVSPYKLCTLKYAISSHDNELIQLTENGGASADNRVAEMVAVSAITYIMTAVLSNVLTLLTFRFVTTSLSVLIVP
jgi:hypothetical protein